MFENVKVGDWVQTRSYRFGLMIVVSVSAKQFKVAPADRSIRGRNIISVHKTDGKVLGGYRHVVPVTKEYARRVAAIRYAEKMRRVRSFTIAKSATLADIKRARKAVDAMHEAIAAITEVKR